MKNEIFKSIKNYEGLYEISNLGRVKSLIRNIILKQKVNKATGYMQVSLHKDGVLKTYSVHRLVAEAFIKNPKNLPQINHKDECKVNNVATNLEWCTAKYNCNYGGKTDSVKKRTNQYTMDGRLVKTWNSLTEIQFRLGFRKTNLSACCNGKLAHAYNFIWKYA